jgi:hypothetical protein
LAVVMLGSHAWSGRAASRESLQESLAHRVHRRCERARLEPPRAWAGFFCLSA